MSEAVPWSSRILILAAWHLLLCSAQIASTGEYGLSTYDVKQGTETSCVEQGLDYFDSTDHSCKTCSSADNKVTDRYTFDGNNNNFQCECATGYRTIYNDCSGDSVGCEGITCSSCVSFGQVAYSDGSGCAYCDLATTNGIVDNECSCPSNQVLLERDATESKITNATGMLIKQCAICGNGTQVVLTDRKIAGAQYRGDPHKCQSCPDEMMSMVITSQGGLACTCADGYMIVGEASQGPLSCALTSVVETYVDEETTAAFVRYFDLDINGVESATFLRYYAEAAGRCEHYGGPEDNQFCQALANLCVLQLYDDQTLACSTFNDIVASRGSTNFVNNIQNWVEGTPWITYQGGKSTCLTTMYTESVSLNKYRMYYVVAKYSLNGTFVGYFDLDTLFSYCTRSAPHSSDGGGTGKSTKWQWFGVSETSTSKCDLSLLLDEEQYFYELYLLDRGVGASPVYIPIPVRIVGTRRGGVEKNVKYPNFLCASEDSLVRRFFLYDIVAGLTEAQPDSPVAVRYAQTIILETSITNKQRGKIYTPVLTIQYKEAQTADWAVTPKTSLANVHFVGRYIMEMDDFEQTLRNFFIAAVVMCGLLFYFRYRNWQIRNARIINTQALTTDLGGFNMDTVAHVMMLLMSTWVMVFFPVTLLVSWYFFTFFKIQSVPSVMLPPQDNPWLKSSPYYTFVVMVHVLALFQLSQVLILIKQQCNADIFFLDWEPVRPDQAAADKAEGKPSGGHVSVWRTILCTNEWTELQTLRRTNVVFTLFFLAFFLVGLDLQYNATPQPELDDKSSGDINIVLRFANTCFLWIAISLGQYLWKFLIYERWLSEPPEQVFMDFCTIAKVSMIVLDEKYHGFYMHCRSPHQFADATMTELVDMLHKEEMGLTTDRSLEGGPQDVQSFEIFVTGEWRTNFDQIHAALVTPVSLPEILQQKRERAMQQRSRSMASTNGGGAASKMSGNYSAVPSDRVLKAWKELAVFLQEFVENNFGKAGLRRTIREPTYYERFTRQPPELTQPDIPSVFLADREFSFSKLLFLGCEIDLCCMDMLIYALFDLWTNNTMAAIFLTYLLDYALSFVRYEWGKAVISRKTLIDARFLI